MRNMVKHRRIGMMDLSAEEFCQSCLPFPTSVIKAINKRLPKVAKMKNDELLTVIKVSDWPTPHLHRLSYSEPILLISV